MCNTFDVLKKMPILFQSPAIRPKFGVSRLGFTLASIEAPSWPPHAKYGSAEKSLTAFITRFLSGFGWSDMSWTRMWPGEVSPKGVIFLIRDEKKITVMFVKFALFTKHTVQQFKKRKSLPL